MPLDPSELECLPSSDRDLVNVLAKLSGVEQRIAEPKGGLTPILDAPEADRPNSGRSPYHGAYG
jgi:hypothetical protein